MNKVFAILVAYNPNLSDLNDSINKLKLETEKIVICNNSDFEINYDEESIKVFNFGENLGIAKAQSIGMKWAFSNGADFILQMDQDSEISSGMLKKLLTSYHLLIKKKINVGLIGPQDYDKRTNNYSKALINKEIVIEDTSCYIVPDILSSGSLIPKSTYDLIGGMDDELFIDIVDFEYCWRIRNKGLLIVKDRQALLAHRLGEGQTKLFGLITINIGATFRHYYQFRNILSMMSRKYVPIKWKASQIIKLILKILFYPIGLKDGIERFKFMYLGIRDFVFSKKGKM